VSSRIDRAIATFLNFYDSHSSATRFLRNGEKYYIYFIDNLSLCLTVKEFSESVSSWSYCQKVRHHVFSETECRTGVTADGSFTLREYRFRTFVAAV